jgi:hypothetical protein
MANLVINGQSTGGKIHELKLPAGKTVADLKRLAEQDGLDQVYFTVADRSYVAEGDGLNLSGLRQNGFQSTELILNQGTPAERSVVASVKLVDDEVNTASDGVKFAASKTWGVIAAGLGISAVTVGVAGTKIVPAVSNATAGVKAMETGFQAVKGGLEPMSQGLNLSLNSAQKFLGPVPTPTAGWVGKITSEVGRLFTLPGHAGQMKTGLGMVSAGAGQAQKGIASAELGMAHFSASAQTTQSGVNFLKASGKVAGITLAAAGAIAAAGAVYGSTRASSSHALAAFREPVWHEPGL